MLDVGGTQYSVVLLGAQSLRARARDLDAIRTWLQARQQQRDGSAVAAELPGGPLPLAKPKA
jgi:hypothetical protein